MLRPESPLASSRQLIVVTAESWTSTEAQLCRFERGKHNDAWTQTGTSIDVSLGKSGLAWGIGRHPSSIDKGAMKREGDGCSPAGIFAITALFGDQAQESVWAQSAGLPYRRATRDLKCIDDPNSRHYNRIVDQGTLEEIDWQSHEDMLRQDQRYAIGAVIAHNSTPPCACAGSCIFLHVWQSKGVPTAGCTASSYVDMLTICRWLQAAADPLLVQLPVSDYVRYKDDWELPPLIATLPLFTPHR